MAHCAIIFSLASGHCKLLKHHLTFQFFSFCFLMKFCQCEKGCFAPMFFLREFLFVVQVVIFLRKI